MNRSDNITIRRLCRGKLLASGHEKALAWISTVGLKLPSRTPEVTVAPASNRTGQGSSILERLKAAVRKSLSINVPKDGDDVNFPAHPVPLFVVVSIQSDSRALPKVRLRGLMGVLIFIKLNAESAQE